MANRTGTWLCGSIMGRTTYWDAFVLLEDLKWTPLSPRV